MRVLFLSQIIPYPPDAGPRMKTWHVLRYLAAKGHKVTLAAFARAEERPYLAELEKLGLIVHTVPMHRSRLKDVGFWLRSHLTGRPFLIERDDLKEMRRLTSNLLAQSRFDVIHADQLSMAQYALDIKQSSFTIFDAHNAVWTIWRQMRQTAPWFLRPIYRIEESRLRRYEGMLVEAFNHTTTVIDPDREALLKGAADGRAAQLRKRVSVIPIAVDTGQLQPVQRQTDLVNILTLGSLHYPPNADGIRWFLNTVFPLIKQQVPQVTLTIIGRNPPSDFLQAAAKNPETIYVTGYVPDLTPYMEASTLLVVPVRAGGGMRVRLLEAFARAMPAVTTTIGLEGIRAVHGREVLVADDPFDFAAETVRLLGDAALQRHLAENGRHLAETGYDWQIVLKQMDDVYALARGANRNG